MNYPTKLIVLLFIAVQATASAVLVEEKMIIGEGIEKENLDFLARCINQVGEGHKCFIIEKSLADTTITERDDMEGSVAVYERLLADGAKVTRIEYTLGSLTLASEVNELGLNQRIVTTEEANEILAMQEDIMENGAKDSKEDKQDIEPFKMQGKLIGMAIVTFKLADSNYIALDNEFIFPASVKFIDQSR